MKHSTSQIQKKLIIIIVLTLVSIITKAQSPMNDDYTPIALAETEEDDNTAALQTFVVNVSLASASERVLEIGKTYIMGNKIASRQGTGNTMAVTSTSAELQGTSKENFLNILDKAIEETKRAKIEHTYLRLTQK